IFCITSMPQGISFGARVVGDWTRSMSRYISMAAAEMKNPVTENVEDTQFHSEVPVQVMIDRPHGGCSVDLGEHEAVLLFAGLLLLLDFLMISLVDAPKRGVVKRTRRIEFGWCLCLVRHSDR